MPTHDIKTTRILYMHLLHSVFDCDRSCCWSRAVTPLNNTDSKHFLMISIAVQHFLGARSTALFYSQNLS